MIINIAHTKGGVGKTTIATNLAINLQCPILDLDFQGSSLRFMDIRQQAGLTVYPIYRVQGEQLDKKLLNILNEAKESRTHHIVIDSGGMDNNIIREGLIYADIIITPVGISQVEFFGLQDFDELLGATDRERTFVLLNNINPNAKKNIESAKLVITDNFQFQLLSTMLGNRVAYKEAYGEGKSVTELGPSKAADEIRSLLQELKLQ